MKPLIIQFSGGRTSAFMTKFLFEHFPNREKHVLFQNTGKEHEETLKFVLECDRRWDLRVVWLESVVHHGERKSSTHKIVDFESASRNGGPYEEVIKKYGLPFHLASTCTRELKVHPAQSYVKSLGITDYEQAIGIRADESHRINRDRAAKENIIYPLADIIQVNKKFILSWWANQEFDLNLPEYLGNCDCCFKKSVKRLIQIARTEPERLSWWSRMEKDFGHIKAKENNPFVFFRGNRSAEDLLALAKETPSLFDNPEYEFETDCFCKST